MPFVIASYYRKAIYNTAAIHYQNNNELLNVAVFYTYDYTDYCDTK